MPLLSSRWRSPLVAVIAAERVSAALGRPLAVFGRLAPRMLQVTSMPKALRNHAITGDEVFITTFAKSGTNWAMQIALQTAYRGHAEFGHIHDLVPWPDLRMPDVVDLAEASAARRAPTGRLIVKTHLPTGLIPDDPRATYICVIRDPKEIAVSAYHFLLGMIGVLDIVDFDTWYQRFIDEGPLMTAWAHHTASVWAWRERPNVLVLDYPTMKADLAGAARRIAEVMGVTLTPAEHDEVVRRSSFAYMSANERQFAPPELPLRRKQPMPKMVRRGQAGGSGELLGRVQARAIDAWCQARLRARGSDFPYAERFGSGPDSEDSKP